MIRIGVDAGGTFTDFVVLDGRVVTAFKIPSTPEHPERAILEGLAQVVGDREGCLIQHGSTVATNTLLERKGAKTLLVTNEGFEDLLEIGRQDRPGLYRLSSSRPEPLVGSNLRLGIKERSLHDGRTLTSLERKSLVWLRNKVKQLAPEAIAVVLLYSYLNPESERKIAEALEFAEVPISLSHQVLPEFREYERTSATVINAYLSGTMSNYLSALRKDPLIQQGRLTIMQSNGGSMPAASAERDPLRTLLSGPAGGVVGAFELLKEAGHEKIITLDMGGTSTDVSLCDGQIATTNEASIDHLPIPVQMIGIHAIGAGGGSIARIDSGGLLRVGPHSAGADPGPVCYGKGQDVTVTDANLFLGRMDPLFFLGGKLRLYPEKAQQALEELATELGRITDRSWDPAEVAQGILEIVNSQMEGAINVVSLQRGYDTRDFTLVCFGGAGGLHACDLARSLLIPRVVIPSHPGILSAFGILRADVVKDTALTVMIRSQGEEDVSRRLTEAFSPLEVRVRENLNEEGFSEQDQELEMTLDARYVGQSYELNIPFNERFVEEFHRAHQRFYGYCNDRLPIEIVNIRVRGRGRYPQLEIPRYPLGPEEPNSAAITQEKPVFIEGHFIPTSFYLRQELQPGNRFRGPAIVLEYSSTIFVPPDFQARIDEWENVILEPLSLQNG
ncbi:MAG: hydantoinase/oxoprolinase family protein [Acidobacteriota bacterium]